MIILTLRTDKPEAEIGVYDDHRQLAYEVWQAHRQLAETIHSKLRDMLAGCQLAFKDIEGIVVFQGPGSFTGLRIGLTVANTLSDGLKVPIIGSQGDDWIETGITRLIAKENDGAVMPFYGAEPHITPQKK